MKMYKVYTSVEAGEFEASVNDLIRLGWFLWHVNAIPSNRKILFVAHFLREVNE